jgi:hypothetical protein
MTSGHISHILSFVVFLKGIFRWKAWRNRQPEKDMAVAGGFEPPTKRCFSWFI